MYRPKLRAATSKGHKGDGIRTTQMTLENWASVAGIISALAIVSAAVFAFFQIKWAASSDRARIFMKIADRWSDIYDARNHVLAEPVLTKDAIFERHGRDYKKFLASDEWKAIRPVCNFFEFLGVILHQKFIRGEELFVLVTVDVFKEIVDREDVLVPDGVMFSKLRGPIEYLREVYRPDIYVLYDKFLLKQYRSRGALTP